MSLILDGTLGITTNSGTAISASTIGVGGTTPSSSGAGITFPATQSASTDANTLDDYEEGTFSPTISSSSGSITSYTVNTATYTKIGRLVYVSINITITNGGTGSGSITLAGLPFSLAASSSGAIWGRETNNTKKLLGGSVSTTNIAQIDFYDNTYCGGTSNVLNINSTYITS